MKCKSCKEELSYKFVAALKLNQCPVCGEAILTSDDHNSIEEVKSEMSSLDIGIDEATMLKVSVAIADKYYLVKKTEEAPEQPSVTTASAPKKKVVSKPITRVGADEMALEEELSESEKEEMIREFGLNHGELSAGAAIDKDGIDSNEYTILFEDYEIDEPDESLLSRAKNTSSLFKRMKRV